MIIRYSVVCQMIDEEKKQARQHRNVLLPGTNTTIDVWFAGTDCKILSSTLKGFQQCDAGDAVNVAKTASHEISSAEIDLQ